MNTELLEALTILEKEKNISKEVLMEAIEQSLIQACKNHFGKADNVHVTIDHETCEFSVYADKTVVEVVEDPVMEISLSNAKMMDSKYELGDIVQVPIQSKQFGRIATQNAKNVILQKIREEERKVLYDEYFQKEKDVVTGVVQRYMGKNVSVNLGKVDAILSENEQVKGEVYKPTERIKVYVLEVKDSPKGPKIMVSRTHPELVKRLFEAEVTEVKDGIVEIKIRIQIYAFDIGQECQFFCMDCLRDRTCRIVCIDIVSIKVFIQTNRTDNWKKILFQQIFDDLRIHGSYISHISDIFPVGIFLFYI